ncbi:MAG: hypothetical protein AAF985_06145 [Bacteroidota bacterium]
MYKKAFPFLWVTLLFFVCSCSDGAHVKQKLITLIELHQPDIVVIESGSNTGLISTREYSIDAVKIEHQFIQIDDEYLNLSFVKSIAVEQGRLKLKM